MSSMPVSITRTFSFPGGVPGGSIHTIVSRSPGMIWASVAAGLPGSTNVVLLSNVTASGCGTMVKDYGHLLRDDAAYAEKARRISDLARDTVEVIGAEWPRIAPKVTMDVGARRVAFQSPCSLQHGMKLKGRVEEILLALGLELTTVADPHLCCGSAGTYSLLQPALSRELRANKLAALEAGRPHLIATANIGCLAHLADGARLPVRHWIELLDERMLGGERAPSL